MNKDEELSRQVADVLSRYLDAATDDSGSVWQQEERVADVQRSVVALIHSHVIEARIKQTFRCDRQVRLIDDMDVRHQWFEKETAELQKLKEGDSISLCPACNCMTKTVDGKCGKCKGD